jgi:hypothetical protein
VRSAGKRVRLLAHDGRNAELAECLSSDPILFCLHQTELMSFTVSYSRFDLTLEPFRCCGITDCLAQSDKGNNGSRFYSISTIVCYFKDFFTFFLPILSINKSVHIVSRLLHKDVLDVQLAIRFSKDEDKNEASNKNYR